MRWSRATAWTLDLSVSDAAGQPVPDRPAAWSSSDPAIATVDRGGLVQALAAGTASITARVDEAADSVTVHVRPPAVAAISLEAPRELTAGRQASAKAKLLDRARRPLEDRGVEWSSSDDAIASVDARGAITAHRPGSVTLTASADGQDASTTLRVTAPVAASVTFAEEIDSVEVGEECQLRATVRDADGGLLERTIAWRSSNARVATVSDEGLVRALAPGRSRITATVDRAVGTTRIAVAAPARRPGMVALPARSRRAWLFAVILLLGVAGVLLLRKPSPAASVLPLRGSLTGRPSATAPAAAPGAERSRHATAAAGGGTSEPAAPHCAAHRHHAHGQRVVAAPGRFDRLGQQRRGRAGAALVQHRPRHRDGRCGREDHRRGPRKRHRHRHRTWPARTGGRHGARAAQRCGTACGHDRPHTSAPAPGRRHHHAPGHRARLRRPPARR